MRYLFTASLVDYYKKRGGVGEKQQKKYKNHFNKWGIKGKK